MRRLLLLLPVSLLMNWPHGLAHAQPYYPYPPPYYAPGYYPPSYYRPPPPPPPMYYGQPPAYYYNAPPAYNPANCGTPDEPKPCRR